MTAANSQRNSTAGAGWDQRVAPGLDDFERLARRAFDQLPAHFRQMCGEIVFVVQDLADGEALDSLGIEDPFELMGLYQGVSLDRKATLDPGREPDMVFLYRRAILDYWAETGSDTIGDVVTHVIVHEIGHHFGLSDDDMERIEATADPGRT
ncbi:MAG: metallopeptidase family protein [Hyphomicrobiaceae bacterium]